MSWLLVFVPIVVILEHVAPQAHTWIFLSACVAIIPIASLIVEATEHIASRTGDAIAGLLNATFGKAPELIIATVALKGGLFDMVRASVIRGDSGKSPAGSGSRLFPRRTALPHRASSLGSRCSQ